MLYSIRKTFTLLGIVVALFALHSCGEKEGCTDPNGENYDSEAEVDDGTCTFARTKFIGLYGGAETCEGGAIESFVVTIEESTTATNALSITNNRDNITVTGIVSGNSLTINDSFDNGGTIVTMVADGTYANNAGQEEITISYTLSGTVNGQTASQSCTGVWVKS